MIIIIVDNFVIKNYDGFFCFVRICFGWGDICMSVIMELVFGGYEDFCVSKYFDFVMDDILYFDYFDFLYKGIRNGVELVVKDD